jgi:hypothetical protein
MNGKLFTKLYSETNLSSKPRKWIGNDDSQRHHHGLVTFDEEPLDIILKWKSSTTAPPKLIGYFRLYLQNLCDADYVSKPRNGKVRLRFYHASDDCIYIQSLINNAPALIIGKF